MQKTQTQCYVLHTKAFKDTSLLVQLFSREFGRFSVVAKGIKRKTGQPKKAILQPFKQLNLQFTGRSDLKTLCDVELNREHGLVQPRSLSCGFYLNEIVLRALEEGQEFASLFTSYSQTLDRLSEENDPAKCLRQFEVSLLTALGIAPQWDIDTSGQTIVDDERYRYVENLGFELVGENPLIDSEGYLGRAIRSLQDQMIEDSHLKEAQRITNRLLRPVIGSKPLQSRKLWV